MARLSVLNRTSRQGTHVSASFAVPQGLSSLIVEGNLTNADLNDVNTVVKLDVFVSSDNGANWQHSTGGSWRGGQPIDPEVGIRTPPHFEFSSATLAFLAGKLIRVHLDLPTDANIGVDLVTP